MTTALAENAPTGCEGRPTPAVVIRHRLPGRTRIAFARPADARRAGAVSDHLGRIGLTVVAVDSWTGSVLVRHDRMVSAEAVVAAFVEALGARPGDATARSVAGAAAVDTPVAAHASATTSPATNGLADASVRDIDAVVGDLATAVGGLTSAEAVRRLQIYGSNRTLAPAGRPRAAILREQVATLPVALLVGSAALSLATGGIVDAVVTLGVVAVNAGIGFATEDGTERLIRRLSKPVEHDCDVLRDHTICRLPIAAMVPGDVLVLSPGTVVAADARVIQALDLTVDESLLTGESLPVDKRADALAAVPLGVSERHNIVHGGTVVTGGDGRAIVIATGPHTEMARTRALIGAARPPRPAIEARLDGIGRGLVLGCLAVSGLVLAIGLARREPLLAMVRSAVALAVSTIPEGLPAVATTTLALGARAMERERAFVRSLPAVEAIGGVDTVCLDKTGTLTENRMRVVAPDLWAVTVRPDLVALAEAVALCNEADPITGAGSATERALIEFATAACVDVVRQRAARPRQGLRNRNHRRRWMATEHGGAEPIVCVKGAPPDVLALADRALCDGAAVPLDDARRAAILAENDRLAAQGLRLLGVARGHAPLGTGPPAGLTWLGLVGLADPVRAEAREAIDTFHKAGIRTIILTGDQAGTALAVAESVAISRSGRIGVVEAADISDLETAALGQLAETTSVFARVSPADKLRIVQALQARGHRVAMIGDGVNDGPALRAAAVGVAMGKNGTDVAREVASIVIADDDLRALVRAIARGRAIDDNIRAALRYLLATNLSEVVVMVVESLHGRGELETPMELFWLNLVTDILPALGLALSEPRGGIMRRPPRAADAPLFDSGETAGLVGDGLVLGSAALVGHFLAMARFGVGPRTRSVTFLTLALGQILHAWTLRDRSPGDPEASRLAEQRLELALAGAGALLALPLLLAPLRRLLGIAPTGLGDLVLAGGLAGAGFAVTEARRRLSGPAAGAVAATSPVSPPARTA